VAWDDVLRRHRSETQYISLEFATSCQSHQRIEEVGSSHEGKALLSWARNGGGGGAITPRAEAVAIVDKALPLSFLAAIVVDSFMDQWK